MAEWGGAGMLCGMLADGIFDYVTPPVLFVTGLAIITWTVVRMRKQAKRDLASGRTTVPTNSLSASDVRHLAEELNTLVAELQDTSRRIAAQIDNRVTKLDILLAEADEKIKRLEAAVTASTPLPDSLPAATPPAEASDPRHRRIYELADQGHSPREIAQQVSMPPGEVELILNLRPKRAASTS